MWGSDNDSRFEKPRIDDGLLEVVGVTGVVHMVSSRRLVGRPCGTPWVLLASSAFVLPRARYKVGYALESALPRAPTSVSHSSRLLQCRWMVSPGFRPQVT